MTNSASYRISMGSVCTETPDKSTVLCLKLKIMIVAILPLQGLTITHFHSLNADITGMLSEIFKIPVKNDGIVF